MKINFLLAALATTTIMSCSTSYKTGQTPDDVYYSPARLQTDNVRRDDDNKKVRDNSVYTTPDDRYIRRRVHNQRYRRYDDRYDYPYGYSNGYNNGYPVYTNPKTNTTQNTSQPRKTNLGAYSPNTTTPDSVKSYNPKSGNINTSPTNPVRTFGSGNSSTNNGSALGNLIRRIFNGDSNSNNNNYNNSNNNYNNSNSNNSSSRTFERSNNNNSNNNNNNSNTKSAPATNSTSAPVRTFKKED